MIFLFGLLTMLLVLVALVLILLVLVQLPKKDAGTGISFGGAAADALFGAGSGNVLTKITTWATGLFFVLIVLLSFVHDNMNSGGDVRSIEKKMQQQQQKDAAAMTARPPAAPPAAAAAAPTNTLKLTLPEAVTAPAPGTPAAPTNKN